MTRRCAHAGCQTILSRYNPERECSIHALPRFGPNVHRALRKRRQEELEGKHPEDLAHRDTDTAWQRYRQSLARRQPRDVMEA